MVSIIRDKKKDRRLFFEIICGFFENTNRLVSVQECRKLLYFLCTKQIRKRGVRLREKDRICYIRPKRALRRLKAAEEENITAYIYGVSGVGKTELIIRYLKQRKYQMFDAARVSAEELEKIAESGRRKIVVIDNLHDLAMEEECEEIKKAIISLVEREDVWLILSGRCAVPPWLAAVRYREVFYVIEESELLFDEAQIQQYLEQTGMILTPQQMVIEKKYCFGFPLGWYITWDVYEQIRQREGIKDGEVLPDELFSELVERGLSQMWDYLDWHVYDNWDIRIQEFLMEVSIVDSFSARLAEMITGRNNVESILSRVKWLGNFMIERTENDEVIYEFRKEMRISMRRRLKRKYNKEQIRALYENAGLCYQLNKEPLLALEMYQKAGEKERIASLLIENARTAPNNGYYYQLKKYYLELSEEKICTSPELMSGMSMLQSLLLNIEESEKWYHKLETYAKEHTGRERRQAKSKLLYLEIGLPHRGSEDMIEILKKAHLLLLDKQVSLQEFSVTSNQASQMNGGKDFCEWSKKDRELAKSIGRLVEFVLGKYGKGLVNLALSESFFEKGEDNYEVAALANKGRMQAEAGGKLEQCFVADGMLAWLHIITGKVTEAEELLCRFYQKAEKEGAVRLLPNIETFLIRCALYGQKKAEIEKWMKKIPDEEQEFSIYDRFHYLTKIRVYLQNGRNEQAYNLLLKCEYYAKVMKRTYITIEVKLLMAIVQYRIGDERWNETLCEGLKMAEEYHFVRIVTREGAAIRPLLAQCSWEPSRGEEKEEGKRNRQFWKQVLEETEKMTRFYPGYLKAGIETVVLSETMLEVLKLQADGLSKEKIAEKLNMSVSNVKYHTQQIYKRLGVSNKAEAVMEAGKRGLL